MPQYVSHSNPWSEAAVMGGELGNTLGGILAGMPQQRAALAIQLAQQKQEQQRAMMQFALQQKEQQQLGQYRDKELELHEQELKQNAEAHQLELQRLARQVTDADARAKATAAGSFKPYKDPATGETFMYNDRTGEVKPFKPVQALPDGQAGPPMPMTPSIGAIAPQPAQMKAIGDMFGQFMKNQQYGMSHPEVQNPTNAAYPQFSQATNMVARLAPLLLGQLGGQRGPTPTSIMSPAPAAPQGTNNVLNWDPSTGTLK